MCFLKSLYTPGIYNRAIVILLVILNIYVYVLYIVYVYFISHLWAFTSISFSFHPFNNVISGFLSLLSPLIVQYFLFLSFSVHLSVRLSLLSGPMMAGRTDQWSMNKTKDSSMPDSFLGPLYFFNLCVFYNLPLCSWQHSESDCVWLSEVFMLVLCLVHQLIKHFIIC